MDIQEYMEKMGYKPGRFVKDINDKYGTNFSKTSIYRMLGSDKRTNPSLELAVAIDLFTNGEVKPIDLLHNSVLSVYSIPKPENITIAFDDDLFAGL